MRPVKKPKLYDLVEFRFNHFTDKWVKVATHKYNLPSAICWAEKKKIEFLRPTTRYTRFEVVLNGTLQYGVIFTNKKRKKIKNTSNQSIFNLV